MTSLTPLLLRHYLLYDHVTNSSTVMSLALYYDVTNSSTMTSLLCLQEAILAERDSLKLQCNELLVELKKHVDKIFEVGFF